MNTNTVQHKALGVKAVEKLIFNVKWILPLFYMGLIGVLFMYGFAYVKMVAHLLTEAASASTVNWQELQMKLWMFSAFIVAAVALGVLEYLHIKGESIEHDTH